MFRRDQYEILQRRRVECEEMSLLANDLSIRKKFAELAVEYGQMAERMHRLDHIETGLAEPMRQV